MVAGDSDYPVRFEVDYPEFSSRWRALLGAILWIKGILLIPHMIILMVLGILSFIAYYIGYWAALITGSYPRGLFDFVAGVQRWSTRTDSWMNGLGRVHTKRSASKMSANEMNPRKITSSFSKREKMRRNPFNRRNSLSISLRLLYISRSYSHG